VIAERSARSNKVGVSRSRIPASSRQSARLSGILSALEQKLLNFADLRAQKGSSIVLLMA
jgi:hypothetical protein